MVLAPTELLELFEIVGTSDFVSSDVPQNICLRTFYSKGYIIRYKAPRYDNKSNRINYTYRISQKYILRINAMQILNSPETLKALENHELSLRQLGELTGLSHPTVALYLKKQNTIAVQESES